MEWRTSISNHAELPSALSSCVETLKITLSDEPDLLFVFSSIHHAGGWDMIGAVLSERFPNVRIIGCSGGGVIGGGYEVEGTPAFSLTAAILPDVEVHGFHIESDEQPSLESGSAGWFDWLGVAESPENIILLPEPSGFQTQNLCTDLERVFPDATIVGGVASGGLASGQQALFLDGKVYRTGAVGLCLSGNLAIDTVVAQGCRPIGPPLFVTRCQDHVLYELDGRSAMAVLEEVCKALEPEELTLAQQALFLGLVYDPEHATYRQGDFLVRNLLGAMPDQGALAVGANLEERNVVQFQVRDARAAWADLDALLARHANLRQQPSGAVMFSCLGRGRSLYGESGHDSRVIEKRLGPVPICGFFCNGEIGPVGGRTWVHGYTSAIAFFRPALPT